MLRRYFMGGCALLTAAAGAQSMQQTQSVPSDAAHGRSASVAVVAAPEATSVLLPLQDFPPGSITSSARAEAALASARVAQTAQVQAFLSARKACYQKLIAEACLIQATEDNAAAERRIRAVQVEAREFQRKQADREVRDTRALKQARDAADAGRTRTERERANAARKEQAERVSKAARDFEAGAPERAKRAEAENKRLAEKRAARERRAAEERAATAQRIERARAHEEKVAAVLKRAQEKEARARDKALPAPVDPQKAAAPGKT